MLNNDKNNNKNSKHGYKTAVLATKKTGEKKNWLLPPPSHKITFFSSSEKRRQCGKKNFCDLVIILGEIGGEEKNFFLTFTRRDF